MRKKKEILEIFDIGVMAVSNRDIFKGMGALCEVLCDLRGIIDRLPHLKQEDLSLYRIPHDDYDPDSLPEPPGKDGKWDD